LRKSRQSLVAQTTATTTATVMSASACVSRGTLVKRVPCRRAVLVIAVSKDNATEMCVAAILDTWEKIAVLPRAPTSALDMECVVQMASASAIPSGLVRTALRELVLQIAMDRVRASWETVNATLASLEAIARPRSVTLSVSMVSVIPLVLAHVFARRASLVRHASLSDAKTVSMGAVIMALAVANRDGKVMHVMCVNAQTPVLVVVLATVASVPAMQGTLELTAGPSLAPTPVPGMASATPPHMSVTATVGSVAKIVRSFCVPTTAQTTESAMGRPESVVVLTAGKERTVGGILALTTALTMASVTKQLAFADVIIGGTVSSAPSESV